MNQHINVITNTNFGYKLDKVKQIIKEKDLSREDILLLFETLSVTSHKMDDYLRFNSGGRYMSFTDFMKWKNPHIPLSLVFDAATLEKINTPITIGGKGYHIGDHVRIVKAYSILHYQENIKGDVNDLFSGMTGTILWRSNDEDYFAAEIAVDAPNDERFVNGRMVLMVDDELELLSKN